MYLVCIHTYTGYVSNPQGISNKHNTYCMKQKIISCELDVMFHTHCSPSAYRETIHTNYVFVVVYVAFSCN